MYIDGLWISNRAGVRLTSVIVIPTQVYKATIFVKKNGKKIQKTKPINDCYIAPEARRGGVEMWVTLARTMSFRLQSASDLSSETTIPHTYYLSAIIIITIIIPIGDIVARRIGAFPSIGTMRPTAR